jgi:hypothetical protein
MRGTLAGAALGAPPEAGADVSKVARAAVEPAPSSNAAGALPSAAPSGSDAPTCALGGCALDGCALGEGALGGVLASWAGPDALNGGTLEGAPGGCTLVG